MDAKGIAVIILVLAMLGLGYYFFLWSPPLPPDIPSNQSAFEEELTNASKVYIVMDIRGADNKTAQNIMQCGVDFAGSRGLVGKEKTIFAIDDMGCNTMNGVIGVDSCLRQLSGSVTFYVQKGNETVFFKNKALVGINNSYQIGECGVH